MEYVAKLFDFLYPFRGGIDVHTSEKGSGNLREAVRLPPGEDLNEWLAVNTVDFFNQVNLLYGTLTKFCTPENFPTMIAGPKQGSGSACRSLFGGFVKWIMGKEDDGSDSLAVQLVDEKHWEDLFIIIVLLRPSLADFDDLVSKCFKVQLSKVRRTANEVANWLARRCRDGFEAEDWVKKPPSSLIARIDFFSFLELQDSYLLSRIFGMFVLLRVSCLVLVMEWDVFFATCLL
ncbi:hypothetical protein GOBAR_DD09530 [Gossypium barbadense]|nr:hypothetical protein GOBAR_DD09530 [Gossypium barbadense]